MCRRLLWSCLVVTLLAGAGAFAFAQPPDAAGQPSTLTRIPGLPGWPPGGVRLHLNGSATCCSDDEVFFADGDLHHWAAVRFSSDKPHGGVLGGDRSRLFVWGMEGPRDSGPDSIWAVDLAGNITVVRGDLPGEKGGAFASRDVGVIYHPWHRRDVELTTDGGATWKVAAVPFPEMKTPPRAEGNAADPYAPRTATPAIQPPSSAEPSEFTNNSILDAQWVSLSRLLVVNLQRAIGLFEIQRDRTLRRVWAITLPELARQFALDGDYVWVCDDNEEGAHATIVHRLRLSDGQINATVKTALPVRGIAACHQALVTWDTGTLILSQFATPFADSPPVPAAPREPDSLSIWTRDAKLGYVRRAKICTRYLDMATGHLGRDVAAVLPQEAPFCLLISGHGAGFRLDLDKATLSPVTLQVTVPPAPVGSDAELRHLRALMEPLERQVPRVEADRVLKEFLEKIDPTRGGRKPARTPGAAAPSAGPPSQPISPGETGDVDFSRPASNAKAPQPALDAKAAAERQRMREATLWAISCLREYLENKKPRVLHLHLATDDDLLHVENLASLEYLYLNDSPITDAGLAHLQGASELRELDLHLTPITGVGLVHLQKLTKLRRLRLSCRNFDDAGLAAVKGFPQLEELDLSGTKITDAGLANLTELTHLRELELSCTQTTDAGLECLTKCTQLRKLDISQTNITDAGLERLKGLTELRWLSLAGSGRSGRMGPNGKIEWTYGPVDKRVGYGKIRITDAGLKHLTALSQLERLDIFCAQITDAGLESLKRLTRLQRLSLNSADVTVEGTANLQRALPNCQFTEPTFW